MAKYTIEYNREGCIGAASCVAAASDVWKMAEDNKADCLQAEFEEDQLDKNMEAAQSCPAAVIHIINNETGERLI